MKNLLSPCCFHWRFLNLCMCLVGSNTNILIYCQTTINSPMYEPFLRVMDVAYFGSEAYENQRNENIEDWQRYFEFHMSRRIIWFVASREEVQKDGRKFVSR